MGTFIVAGKQSDYPVGAMHAINLEGTEVLVANIGGNIYALNNRCPHMGGKLSKGLLSGQIVTCPLHGSQFDITTGENVRWLKGTGILSSLGKAVKHPANATKYNVKVDGQQVLIEV
ncbi:MAG: Rieske (2Fe-2S) protein [Dehalococcoidia bacterium]|nr:MAG: Rieske (2Fe-2S) protein [Dehalococcoidia bacterium]